ncbi:MAG TPA: DUF1992 domain-containing protein [Tepidisphaeraceae bacterium]|jgi:hypothetical protein|nr:DUF1992 domain-containing protein [Tepidisphaeraceae bacterium]
MGLKDIDIEGTMRRLADRQIEEAMRQGKFDNLPGMGEPIDLDDMPAGEDARMTWWALRILKQNDVVPDEVRWRKQIDRLKADLAASVSEARVRAIVLSISMLVHRVNTMGTNALKAPVIAACIEEELLALHKRIAPANSTSEQ